jgi:hypothetical protein
MANDEQLSLSPCPTGPKEHLALSSKQHEVRSLLFQGDSLANGLSIFDHLIDQTVLLCFLSRHIVISIRILPYSF